MKFLRFLLFLSVVATSCNVINKEEDIPSFITLDEYILDAGTLGSGHHNITDAWVSANGEFIGVFELPTTIPVLTDGPTEISISPGIKNFGIANDRQDYALIENFDLTAELVPGEVITLSPEINFFPELILQNPSEDFSQPNTNFVADEGTYEWIEDPTLNSSPLTDIGVGQYTLEDGLLEITSNPNNPFSVVNLGPTFLEFDYQTTEKFLVGIKSGLMDDDKTYLLGITPQYDEFDNLKWNRMYLNLETYIDFYHSTGINGFSVFFENELGAENLTLKLDNIKVISLEP